MRTKWHFRNEPTPAIGETRVFSPKSTLFYFLSEIEHEICKEIQSLLGYSNLSKEECNTALKMKFSVKDFYSKYDQIHRKLQIKSYLKKSIIENFNFCAVQNSTFFS